MQVLPIHNGANTTECPPLGKLIVLTGPSGVGKGTLMNEILKRYPELHYSVSATTRSPRSGEIDGKNYYFIARNKFEQLVTQGEFLEWAEFAGNCYGTPREAVLNHVQSGKLVVLEIELEGARQVRTSFPSARSIFILPPSFSELENRIRGRGQDSEEAIARRLQRAEEEIAAANEFDIKIINDDFEKALTEIEKAIFE
ncbi:guanylate kinase [Dolichospermum sp. ST_sed1]|nr:guanylate kinase [Dolichospermum sp. ST_sed1]MDD1428996.1 guanylate kinase [Dolichospermum sp. ST_sed9]MDD1434724.1 guanylate kinase [Dolichospermum sp. ST_sed6]MDD1444229.1 guanylate kinase [Dolichospermum sp. ST_sed3]MDD1449562.1 guanylate kinase [Dolichospermum sp. ST_sed8]MDD1458389.1 guanylate kinase [Dolichospermum sp. ST_sed7]MDD1463537.1 guanylate kinase [Dolichospermum sp. ST_sed2]MDD1469521.1 guanylate kinase [Dolichospermum sp. ST_sed5]MDD1474834.1 guanylate kinase [Dolichospe